MILLWVTFIAMSGSANADNANLVKELVALRGEIETLGRETDVVQKERQAELDMWTQRRLELESGLQKENFRRLQVEEKKNRLTKGVKQEARENPKSKGELLAAVRTARQWAESALPFSREARISKLQSIEDRLDRGSATIEALAGELWAFYETELKMATENEFRIIEVPGANGPSKVEAVRLGFYAMYTRGVDGGLSEAFRTNGQWSFRPIADSQKSEMNRLIDNVKQKRRAGIYGLLQPGKDIL